VDDVDQRAHVIDRRLLVDAVAQVEDVAGPARRLPEDALHLAADLVVLSACQTGLGSGALADVPAGDDWVGLTRAFLHAGAGHVVATLWPVDDWATAALMERFYDGYSRDADPARALAAAQRQLLVQPATSHPFYWAGFVTVGKGDGGRGKGL